MTDSRAAQKEVLRPFPVGAKVRYWLVNGKYWTVTVIGYTPTGRVRVRREPNEAGYAQTSVVRSTSLSTL